MLHLYYRIILVLKETHSVLGTNPRRDLKNAGVEMKFVTEVLNYDSILNCQLSLEVSEPHKLLCDFEVSQLSSFSSEWLKIVSLFGELTSHTPTELVSLQAAVASDTQKYNKEKSLQLSRLNLLFFIKE